MRVLVVEDEPEFANLIAEGLRDQGMAVDIAYDGLAGASKLNVNPYDVVVLDRDLPGVHGDTLCRMITGSHDPAMILMLTAAGSPAERVAGLALGADDYLPKPFHFPELVLRIRALARRKPAAQDRTLTAAGIELDPLARTATRDGRQLDLSAKEFAVLEALLRASPGALSAERLLEQAWDENADPFTNTVTGHDRPPAPQARRTEHHPERARHRIPHYLKASEPGEQPEVHRPYPRIAHIGAAPIKERARTQAVTVPNCKQCEAPESGPSATRYTKQQRSPFRGHQHGRPESDRGSHAAASGDTRANRNAGVYPAVAGDVLIAKLRATSLTSRCS